MVRLCETSFDPIENGLAGDKNRPLRAGRLYRRYVPASDRSADGFDADDAAKFRKCRCSLKRQQALPFVVNGRRRRRQVNMLSREFAVEKHNVEQRCKAGIDEDVAHDGSVGRKSGARQAVSIADVNGD